MNKAETPGTETAPRKKHRVGRAIARFFGVVLVLLLAAVILILGAVRIVCTGPFPTARDIFVVTVTETSALKFLATLHFSQEEVDAILQANAVLPPDEVTDVTAPFAPPAQQEEDKADIEIIEVTGSTFKGKMMIIHDPSRVRLATIPQFGADVSGRRVEDLVKDNNAIAGINAGGFVDLNGVGKGGQPLGVLIHNGVLKSGSANTENEVIGITFDHRLVVGKMTGQQALDLGVRDAVYFFPILIVNGKPAEVSAAGGVNPRTCIGQRADGAMLFLVIDGRQAHSMGATMEDCLQVMLDFEAVNAANLDGGSSSVLVYEGEIINVCASLYGSRYQPAAWVVDRLPEDNGTSSNG